MERTERTDWIELSSGPIEYLDTGGDGPVLVPVHGVLMDHTVWRAVVTDLRADHRLVVPTMPLGAHRRPMRAGADLSMRGQARLLGELLARLELRDVTLIANDWGGPQLTALDHPDVVGRLVLTPCEAFDNLPPGLPGTFAGIAGRLPGGLLPTVNALRLRAARRLPMTFGWMATGPIPDDLFRGWLQPALTQRGVRRDLAAYVRTTDRHELVAAAERLRTYERPTLVVWSTDDKVMPRAHGQRLADLVPDGRLVEVPDSRTLMPLDQPAPLATLVRAFVNETRERSPATQAVAGRSLPGARSHQFDGARE